MLYIGQTDHRTIFYQSEHFEGRISLGGIYFD